MRIKKQEKQKNKDRKVEQSLDCYESNWFLRLKKKIRWMPLKKKMGYVFLVLIALGIGVVGICPPVGETGKLESVRLSARQGSLSDSVQGKGVLADKGNSIKENSSGKVLGESAVNDSFEVRMAQSLPDTVGLCEGTELEVTPSYTTVSFYLCTYPLSYCTVTLPDVPAEESDESDEENHYFTFTGLNQGTIYNYNIVCEASRVANDYVESGSFTTLIEADLNINDVRATEITSNRAKISWVTNKLSDSRIIIIGDSGRNRTVRSYVTSHSITLTGLSADTEYIYYVKSVIDGGDDSCTEGNSTPECGASVRYTFTTLKSASSPDANVVLKVDRDRVCDEWLYCNAAVQLPDFANKNKLVDYCFSVGVCSQIDKGGRCINIVDEGEGVLTKEHPNEVQKIRNLSGYSKVGLDWGYRCANTGLSCSCVGDVSECDDLSCGSGSNAKCVKAKIAGYYPYSVMKEVGLPVNIPNPNFEDGTVRPWKEHNNAEIDNIKVDAGNLVMKVEPDGVNSGAKALALAKNINISQGAVYVISFRAKTRDPAEDGQNILVELGPYGDGQFMEFKYYDEKAGESTTVVKLMEYWQDFVMSLDASRLPVGIENDDLNITIVQADQIGGVSDAAFYIDNIDMKSVLEIGDPLNYVARSCRMYPTQNAPACNYYDEQKGKDYKGWKGYCVETDPGYLGREYTASPVCLQWWPVDIVQGEANIFSSEPVVGYTGRKPLYYCLEARGNYERDIHDFDTAGCDVTPGENSMYHTNCSPIISIVDCNNAARCSWTYYNNSHLDHRSSGEYKLTNYIETIMRQGESSGGITLINTTHSQYLFPADGGEDKESWDISKYDIVGIVMKGGAWHMEGSLVNSQEGNWTSNIKGSGGTESGVRRYYWKDSNTWVFEYKEINYEIDIWDIDSCEAPGNFVGLELKFNDLGKLERIYVRNCDDDVDSDSTNIDLTFHFREPCWRIVKVVDEDGRTVPWMERLNSEVINDEEWIGYNKSQDYNPFGSAVVPEGWDPEDWDRAYPLNVEPVDKSSGSLSPYQLRGGSPFGSSRGDGTCVSFTTGTSGFNELCYDDIDCNSTQSCYLSMNPEYSILSPFGRATCVSGPNVGALCPNGPQDCGMSPDGSGYGICAGFNYDGNFQSLNHKMLKLAGYNYHSSISHKSEHNLSQLFAESFGVWEWRLDSDDGKFKYLKIDDGWDITDTGKLPKVSHVFVNDSEEYDYKIIGQGAAILKFTSWVDPDQVPLVRYSVDWDDGSTVSEAGLRIVGRDLDNPHVLVHYYRYSEECDTGFGYCVFKPEVQIEDNWGQCNEVGDCKDRLAWRVFNKEIRVYRELEGGLPDAPTNLTAGAGGSPIDRVNLSWADNSNNEDGFRIERSLNGSTGWEIIARVGANTTSYTDFDLLSPYIFVNLGECSYIEFEVLIPGTNNLSLMQKVLVWLKALFTVDKAYALPECIETYEHCISLGCDSCEYDTSNCSADSDWPYQCSGSSYYDEDYMLDANECASPSIETGNNVSEECGDLGTYIQSRECLQAYYRVSAFNDNVFSPFSNVASADGGLAGG